MRKSGVLLPVASLPSAYGIGCFDKKAYEFIDRLKEAGQGYWQILPLGPTGYGNSPYQSFSTFAGNAYYISLEDLIERGYLTREQCDAKDFGTDDERVDYEKLYAGRFGLLRLAFLNSHIEDDTDYQMFVNVNAYWLDNYALYMTVKKELGGICWTEWEEDIRLRRPEAVEAYQLKCAEEIAYYKFEQYMFHIQWKRLKEYANRNGVRIIGDIPIYVAFDSADAWANPELFQLDEQGRPEAVAGCPPDAFSATGQLWGNPLYRWEYHAETGYVWWLWRMKMCFERFDVVRIDHFRGFDEYYSIPYGAENAIGGKWMPGPGYDFFEALQNGLGEKEVIAEDLGYLTETVLELLKRTGYPGMKVLQFAFGGDAKNAYLPHNHIKNSVVYTGTHDNDTLIGWYDSLTERERKHCDEYLCLYGETGEEVRWQLIATALASVADLAVVPMQDYLGLDSGARINTPSVLGENWQWRMKDGAFGSELAGKMRELVERYDRL